MEMILVYILITAFVLDLIFGDPLWLPHLIVLYGNLISKGEKLLNKGNNRFIKGAFLTLVLVSSSFILPYYIISFFKEYSVVGEVVFSVLCVFYCLANKTLVTEGKAVFKALADEGVVGGRKRLARIVGRDTTNLNEQQIKVATFETMSENLSDGIIAPLFYFMCFGVPGIMAYKMINTFDSMIGYKNDRYEQFGKFAAKLDDVVNFIPARLTALLIIFVGLKPKGLGFIFKEGKKHSSPNAGYPEAALAYVLNCQFGGANYYGGKLIDKPCIGSNNRRIENDEITKVAWINYTSSTMFVTIYVLFSLWINL